MRSALKPSLSLLVVVTDVGVHAVDVGVDTTGAVTESDEGNNARSESWAWLAAPDLVVTDIWSSTLPMETGVEENMTCQITNQGAAAVTESFYVVLRIDGVDAYQWLVNGLTALSSTTVSANLTPHAGGSTTVQCEVDTTGAVSEGDESNNVRTESRWYWNSPDLLVEEIWSGLAKLETFQIIDIISRSTNDGDVSTSEWVCAEMSIDGHLVAANCRHGLALSQDWVWGAGIKVCRPGRHEISVEIDAADAVPETDEGNNVRTETWTWQGEATYLPIVTRGF